MWFPAFLQPHLLTLSCDRAARLVFCLVLYHLFTAVFAPYTLQQEVHVHGSLSISAACMRCGGCRGMTAVASFLICLEMPCMAIYYTSLYRVLAVALLYVSMVMHSKRSRNLSRVTTAEFVPVC
ncbi:hypothetical protein COO60DRAFT_1515137 [Scenedesmus sp. NREL 46B-D3]|nr:hypothetical protein COO60DRAFT_1515137 [Scenedesmus sp. NREL 46B-D3]